MKSGATNVVRSLHELGLCPLNLNNMIEKKELTMKNECYSCKHKRLVPGDAHIECAFPDPKMTGNEHGIKHGWFMYPILFDPVWKTKKCNNFEFK